MKSIGQLQSIRNAETRDGWNCFASHRHRVTRYLLDAAATTNGKLCVLGAGNCNDLNLHELAAAFDPMDLVDIDRQAIVAGLDRQAIVASKVNVHAPLDATGIASLLADWTVDTPAPDEQVDACIVAARRAELPLASSSYAVAASICLLSQLIEFVTLTLGTGHARFIDLMTCVRREHVRQLVDLVRPGGSLVLITDVVSSSSLPELATAAGSQLSTIVGQAIAQRNFFTGVNPFVIKRLLETDLAFSEQLTDVRLSDPWVWDLGPRLYAVCALTAKRV